MLSLHAAPPGALVAGHRAGPPAPLGRNVQLVDNRQRIIPLPRLFVRQFLGFDPPASMGLHRVTDDTMAPALSEGDYVLHDFDRTGAVAGIHVARYDVRTVCRRLHPAGHGFRVLCDNRAAGYAPELLRRTPAGFVQDDTGDCIRFDVLGRVLFPRPETVRVQLDYLAALLREVLTGPDDSAGWA